MARASYLPDRGDLAWINFEPQAGREQAKKSTGPYAHRKKLQSGDWSRHRLPCDPDRATVRLTCGVCWHMVEQVQSVDWQARGAAFIEAAPLPVLDHVKQILAAILDMAP